MNIFLSSITKSIEELDPIFADEQDWRVARRGLRRLNDLLVIVKDIIERKKTETNRSLPSAFDLMKSLSDGVVNFTSSKNNYADITRVLDASYLVIQDGVRLTNKLLDRHQDQLTL